MNKIKHKFSILKLNQKFAIIIAGLVIIPMAFFAVVLFQNMKEKLISQAQAEEDYYVSENSIAAQKIVEMCNMSTQTFLNSQELQGFLTRLKKNEEITTREYLEFAENNIAMLERLVNSNPYLYHICVYAENDTFPEMIPILYRQERAKKQSWYEEYNSGEWQYDYSDNLHSYSRMNESEHLMALVSDFIGSDGEKAGIVEVAVLMEDMFPNLYDTNPNIWACLVQKDGTVYTGGQKGWEEKQEDILKAAADLEDGNSKHIRIKGEDMILTVKNIDGLRGTYVQANSLQEMLHRLNMQRNIILAVLLCIFGIMVLAINWLVQNLLKKFYQILETVRQVRSGNLEIRTGMAGEKDMDEMGELGRQIDQMLDKIQSLMQENINREVLVKNTEIKALQNQINAHFIYNVLESVKMMAEIEEEYEISDAVTALGELLRYGMKWVSGTVEISQELQYIRNYIQLMNLRYDFVIQLSVSLPEFVYRQQIPKMSLQPIVENAICHGIEEMDEDATIYIKGIEKGDDYLIEITDSGVGMSPQKLELLERKLRGEIEVNGGSGNGIGLKNVQDRIQIQFGSKYGLQFYSIEGCYTKVSILLPKTEKKVEEWSKQ